MNPRSDDNIQKLGTRGCDATYNQDCNVSERAKAADNLIERITAAFHGVVLGGGIGLMEAQGIDDCEDEATCAAYRATDEKDDWRKVTDEDLNRCNSSPSFLDAEGFRFYMPAFMISEIRGKHVMHFLLSLVDFGHLGHERYKLLNAAQRSVVRDYLIFFASDPADTFFRDDIMRALDTYWTESSCKDGNATSSKRSQNKS